MKSKRLPALALSLALLLTGCAGPQAAAAATMHLRRTEGSVEIADGEGRDVTPAENLGLYSGYQVSTSSESYAWIDLDSVKLTKLDENSEISIRKVLKQLEVEVISGSLFFNVTEPLEENETLNIRTSSLVVGIRGTCGWVTQETACLLEGTVTVTAGDQSVTVAAGEMAVLTEDGQLTVTDLPAAAIPAFVRDELAEDEVLTEQIEESSGISLNGGEPDESPDTEIDADLPVSDIFQPVRYYTYPKQPGIPDHYTRYELAYEELGAPAGWTAYRVSWDSYEWADEAWHSGDSGYWEITYDQLGRMQEMCAYDSQGELLSSQVMIENTATHSLYSVETAGQTRYQAITYYDSENGRRIRSDHDLDGSIYTFHYDDQGRLVRINAYSSDWDMSGHNQYEYDS